MSAAERYGLTEDDDAPDEPVTVDAPLYRIAGDLGAVLDAVLAADGVISPEHAEAMERLTESLEDKVERIALRDIDLQRDIDGLTAEINRLAHRKAALERAQDWARGYAAQWMLAVDRPNVKTPRVTVWTQETQRVEWTRGIDEEIPAEYRRVVTTVSPDKLKALKAHRAGRALPAGFEVSTHHTLRVR